eukprot:14380517-Alexandrium_andersonii.AAC.1
MARSAPRAAPAGHLGQRAPLAPSQQLAGSARLPVLCQPFQLPEALGFRNPPMPPKPPTLGPLP